MDRNTINQNGEDNMFVQVSKGRFRQEDAAGQVFPVVKPFKVGRQGGFLMVDAKHLGFGTVRLRCEEEALTEVDVSIYEAQSETVHVAGAVDAPPVITETDDEIVERLGEYFEILDVMSASVINGTIRSMIVTGPPGVGKSFGIEAQLEKADFLSNMGAKGMKSEVVKGAMTPLGLYQKLWDFADGGVIVFDDCDMILYDDLSLNLLKAALDSGKKRTISWASDSHVLNREDIPNKFEFKGSIIFITNVKFEHVRSKKLQDHLAALMSRSHYLDLTIDTPREKLLRIRQIARTGQLFSKYNFDAGIEAEILEFIEENQNKLNELSLRTALKVADLVKTAPTNWQKLARATVCRRGAPKLQY